MAVFPIPKWAQVQYAKLWATFKNKEITHLQISKLLNETENRTSVLLNHLKKAGWITISLSPEDSRKRIYTLKHPQKIMEAIANGN